MSSVTGAFTVLAFEGEESVSQPFEYRLTLAFDQTSIAFADVVNQDATLTMTQAGNSTVVTGVVSSFRVTEELDADMGLKCDVVLVPKLWRLGLFHRSRVFQDLTVVQIVQEVMKQDLRPATQQEINDALAAGTSLVANDVLKEGIDYKFVWSDPVAYVYPKREFVMQYQETDLAFIQRLLEDIGLYYFYDGGMLVITDVREMHPDVEGAKAVQYEKPGGAMSPNDNRVYRFVSNESVIPKTVSVRDHDFESFQRHETKERVTDPDTNTAEDYARVGTYAEHGLYSVEDRGWVSSKYGEDGEGIPGTPNATAETNRISRLDRIALVRAEALETQRARGEGLSNAVRLQAGHVFALTDYFLFPDEVTSKDYFVTSVRHRYTRVPRKVTITDKNDVEHHVESTEKDLVYENEFTCLPAEIQYRPPRITPIPRVPGIMTATVKQGGDDENYLDAEGRYRVRFPFDPTPDTARKGENATQPSRPIRLAQPYAGTDYGMHFPNRQENVEMVFACIDGNPNRPLGLSVVPTPWTHSPVPNTRHGMRTQNPIAGALTTTDIRPEGEEDGYYGSDFRQDASKPYYFDELKNIIRTQKGHQIVMDDNDGGANVGITIQTGSSDSGKEFAGGKNKYWFSRIDMGGYRVKSGAEQIIDGITEVTGYLATLVTRNLREYLSLGLGITASVAEAGDYLVDTYGNTTPVGVNVSTAQAVSLKGGNGVNITSPNLFGLFSTAFIGDEKEQRISQHYLELVTKAINNIVFQGIMNDTVSEFKKIDKLQKKLKAKGKTKHVWKAIVDGKRRIKKSRISAWALTILQRSGVNISSAGDLKMSALQGASLVGGLGGIVLKSQGSIEQGAKGAIELESHEGITISTKGRSYTEDSKVEQALDTLATVFPPLVAFIKAEMAAKRDVEEDEMETSPITINNESGDILLHTGVDDEGTAKGKGNIIAQAEGKGDVKAFADNGHVHLWSGDKGVLLETGSRKDLKDKFAIEELSALGKNKANSRLFMDDDVWAAYSAKKAWLSVGKSWDDASNAGIIIRESGIKIECGKSSIELKNDGTITIEGNKIIQQATADIQMKGANVKTSAKGNVTIEGMKLAMNAKTQAVLAGKVAAAVEGQMTTVKGTLVKVG